MKKVFINKQGEISLTKKNDSIKVAEIHRFQGRESFETMIEVLNYNQMPAEEANREWAYKCKQSPYTSSDTTIVYIDNIREI